MKRSAKLLHKQEIDYDSIIRKVWQQFQSGQSILSKNGGLRHWTARFIPVEKDEIDIEWRLRHHQHRC
jgi:hypothetical protein